MFNNKVYDKLKFVAQIGLPALGTLYFTVATIYGVEDGAFDPEKVSGTILAIDTFLGVLLGLSNKQFMNDDKNFAGDLHVVNTEDEGVQTMLAFNPGQSPESLENQKTVTMKVVQH